MRRRLRNCGIFGRAGHIGAGSARVLLDWYGIPGGFLVNVVSGD